MTDEPITPDPTDDNPEMESTTPEIPAPAHQAANVIISVRSICVEEMFEAGLISQKKAKKRLKRIMEMGG